MIRPREAQRRILQYTGGRLAVSAVPGSGKTTCLMLLARKLIVEDRVRPAHILILTYTRSAAANIRERIRFALLQEGVSARGLKAKTIHGFCHELLSRHCRRLGLMQGFEVVQEHEQMAIVQKALLGYLSDRRREETWAKSLGIDLQNTQAVIDAMDISCRSALKALSTLKNLQANFDEACLALSIMGFEELPVLIHQYQQELVERRKLDYDDLLLQTNQILDTDPEVLAGLQQDYPYVLEDEAQDSTWSQKILIDKLVQRQGNLLRVGDANQSIYATFTMNTPQFFRDFCRSAENVTMNESNRSCSAIIELANNLVCLAATHPYPYVAQQAFVPNFIMAARDGSNPPSLARAVRWRTYKNESEEATAIAEEVRRAYAFLHNGKYMRLAILIAKNIQAEAYARALADRGIPVATGGAVGNDQTMVGEVVLRTLRFLTLDTVENRYLQHLAEAYLALYRHRLNLHEKNEGFKSVRNRLIHFIQSAAIDWLELLGQEDGHTLARPFSWPAEEWGDWLQFAAQAGSLLRHRHISPLDLVALVAETFFDDFYQLSVAQAIALIIRRILYNNPGYRLAEVLDDLTLADNASYIRRLFPTSLEEIARPAQETSQEQGPIPVKILTLHGAKGLEFDCVWIPTLNDSHDFPWLPEQARVDEQRLLLAEKTIEAIANKRSLDVVEIQEAAAQEQVCERLRLLYVGITRARQFLRLSYREYADPWVLQKNPHLAGGEHIARLRAMSP